jgi:hypothetical protein
MYALENKSYGLKLTLREPLASDAVLRLRNELKAHLLCTTNDAQGIVVDMRSPSSPSESLERILYTI